MPCATALGVLGGLIVMSSLSACGDGNEVTEVSTPRSPAARVTAATYEQYDGLFAEWRDAYVACARAEGLDASVPEDANGIDGGSSPDRPRDKTGLDLECIQKVGSQPESPPLTAETLNSLFDLSVAQADCLRAAGYPVKPARAREVWVESYTSSAGPWLPLDAVFEAGGDVVEAVRVCPDPDPRSVAP